MSILNVLTDDPMDEVNDLTGESRNDRQAVGSSCMLPSFSMSFSSLSLRYKMIDGSMHVDGRNL